MRDYPFINKMNLAPNILEHLTSRVESLEKTDQVTKVVIKNMQEKITSIEENTTSSEEVEEHLSSVDVIIDIEGDEEDEDISE